MCLARWWCERVTHVFSAILSFSFYKIGQINVRRRLLNCVVLRSCLSFYRLFVRCVQKGYSLSSLRLSVFSLCSFISGWTHCCVHWCMYCIVSTAFTEYENIKLRSQSCNIPCIIKSSSLCVFWSDDCINSKVCVVHVINWTDLEQTSIISDIDFSGDEATCMFWLAARIFTDPLNMLF